VDIQQEGNQQGDSLVEVDSRQEDSLVKQGSLVLEEDIQQEGNLAEGGIEERHLGSLEQLRNLGAEDMGSEDKLGHLGNPGEDIGQGKEPEDMVVLASAEE
jgi:hypothetical protein